MAKLMEKNGAELCSTLVSIATPLKRFLDDAEFEEAWKNATKKGLETGMSDILQIYTDIVPMLFGDRHLKDTMAILAAVEGKTVKQLLAMNGVELMSDALKAFNEQIKPFFIQLGVSVGVK